MSTPDPTSQPAPQPAPQPNAPPAPLRFLIVFSGGGYASDGIAHLVSALEGRGHHVEWVSYAGLAAEAARSVASASLRGINAALRTVTGRLMGDDPLGLSERVASARPHALITTTPELARATRVIAGSKTLRVGLMTDLAWDPQWTASENDLLVVSHPLFREYCLQQGWRYEAVALGGVPLPRPFCAPLDADALRARFGLSADQGPILMVVAEDVEAPRLERIVFQLSLTERPFQPIFYTGADAAASATLRAAAHKYGVRARMFGRVDNLEEFYAVSDAVLIQAASPLAYPMLALDKPLLLFDTAPEQQPLAAFLRDEAAALLIPDLLRLSAELDALFSYPDDLERLRVGARHVVDQQGVSHIIAALEASAAQPEQFIGLSRNAPAADPAPDAPPPGPFEVIGASPAQQPARAPAGAPSGAPPGSHPPQGRPPARPAPAYPSEHHNPITIAEAREQLAAIILEERRVDGRLADATRLSRQWIDRLDMARQAAAQDLAAEAERFSQHYAREVDTLQRELDRLRDQKEKLKRRVVRPTSASASSAPPPSPLAGPYSDPATDTERRFRDMEVDRDLARLKARIKPRDP
jgi:hypothetical protein